MADARELKDQAAKHFAKGRFDKAASVYAELCQLEPNDTQLRIRLGDARVKAGDAKGAVEAYRGAAEDYAHQGFLPRAIAACKRILDLEPGHQETQVALARLYAKRSSAKPARPVDASSPQAAPGVARDPVGSGEASLQLDTEFRFSELELGAADLEDLEAAVAKAAPGAPAAVKPGGWFASPDVARLSLAELQIGQVDEAADIEVLTVSSDPPGGAPDVPEVPLFSALSREAFVELVSRCGLHRAAAGETIIQEGSVGASFFAVSSGAVKVVRKRAASELVLARLGAGDFFGEMALLSGAPRTASVVAAEPTELLEISASLLAGLLPRYPHVGQVLKRFCRERFLANVLSSSRIFAQFAGGDRQRLVERFQAREAAAGEHILEEGRASDGLYVVVAGAVEVLKSGADGPAKLAELREGDLFGEISLLTKSAATATIAALGPAALLKLPRRDFDELICTHPQISGAGERAFRRATSAAGRAHRLRGASGAQLRLTVLAQAPHGSLPFEPRSRSRNAARSRPPDSASMSTKARSARAWRVARASSRATRSSSGGAAGAGGALGSGARGRIAGAGAAPSP